MSSNNAPQPDAASPAAEVFDSTITPSTGQVSQDALPGPQTTEAPVHTGSANGIDPYFFTQFIALVSFVWDVSQSPGQLLWSIPIHPSYCHVYLAHLAKMYNAWAGGVDFAVTLAGTGFHAGKLMVVRLPPNIRPESLRTTSAITAFPYYVIDPKTLETVVKSAMDQRNIMYHYLPYDVNNYNSFGGYLAIYCLLPLNTSSSGASQISVQIFSRPSQTFMYTQLRPLRETMSNPYEPKEIEAALDFRTSKTSPLFLSEIRKMFINAGTEMKELKAETQNCLKLDGTLMNSVKVDRFESNLRLPKERFPAGIKTLSMRIVQGTDKTCEEPLSDSVELESITDDCYLSWDELTAKDGNPDGPRMPVMQCKKVRVGLDMSKGLPSRYTYFVSGEMRRRLATDPDTVDVNLVKIPKQIYGGFMSLPTRKAFETQYIDAAFLADKIDAICFFFDDKLSFDTEYKPYAPPINESIITFETDADTTCQPFELQQAILSADLKSSVSVRDSLIFELIDGHVDLPLLPVRLHYNGYFSTIPVQKNVEFKFTDPERYFFKFVGTIPETTGMVGSRLKLQAASMYRYNITVSRMSSSLST